MNDQYVTALEDTYIPDPDADIIENVPSRRKNIIMQDAQTRRTIVLFRSYQLIWFFLGVIETLLVFRFILKMIGASTISGFTDFVYALSLPFATPFLGMLPASVSGASILEWSTLIGMIVYLVVAFGLIEIIRLLTPLPTTQDSTAMITRKTRYAL